MNDLQTALARLLRPLIRLLIARGVGFPQFSDWAKTHYIAAAEQFFQVDGKRVTDSRLHLLTGLQRKDIKALRSRQDQDISPPSAGPVARVIGLWLSNHSDSSGNPGSLRRDGPAPSFQALVAQVSRDVHMRTIQDELIRQGLAQLDGDSIQLIQRAFLPSDDDAAMLGYLGANLGDHASASVENVLAAPDAGAHLERAVHYNNLTAEALDELNALSRQLLSQALADINTRASQLQARDQADERAKGRFRAGAFVYRVDQEDAS